MLKKFMISLLILSTSLFASVKHIDANEAIMKGKKVIDIRTEPEWRQTGIVKGSYTIMFFDEKGQYDIDAFLNALNKIVKKKEEFVLICRTGSRTTMVSQFLSDKLGYDVINLKGGILQLISQGYKTSPYKK